MVENGIRMEQSIQVNVAPHQAFEFWRTLENFPRFMAHIKEVKATKDNRYTWKVDGPLGTSVSWEADVTDVVQDKRISWKTVGDAQVANSGSVEFSAAPAGGTLLQVKLSYDPPAGKLGHAVATLFGMNPEQQMKDDLQRCKQILEQGMTAEGVTRSEVQQAPAHKPH
jgi:uncharacterized membrane protein